MSNGKYINTWLSKVANYTIIRLGHDKPNGTRMLYLMGTTVVDLSTGRFLYGDCECTFVRDDFKPTEEELRLYAPTVRG